MTEPSSTNKSPRGAKKSLVVLFRSLATLQAAAVPLTECFTVLGESSESEAVKRVCLRVAHSVCQGMTVSQAMTEFPDFFSRFHIHLVKMGEETGTLDSVLRHIADYEEAQQRLRQRIQSALVYPTVVAGIALLGLMIFPPYVLEGLFEVIRSSGVEPPLLTQVVMRVSSAMGSPWLWLFLIGGIALAVKPAKALWASATFRSTLLAVPGLGRCLRCSTSARFAAGLSICQRAGLQIQRALVLAALATDDPLLMARMPESKKAIEGGVGLAEGLSRIDFFSPLFLEILASGEEVGRTEDMLSWLASSLEKDLEQELNTYASLLEPLMLVLVGTIVGILVIATASPMISLVQNL